MKSALACIAMLFVSITASATDVATERLKIVASIKPVALIAQEIVADQGQVTILIPQAASPHQYSLKVSDAKLLAEASLLIWVGEDLETFLTKRLNQAGKVPVLTLIDIPGIHFPASLNATTHDHEGGGDNHQHGEHDPHIWLDPDNAIVIAAAITESLIKLRPELAETFKQRRDIFSARIKVVDQQLAKKLAPLAGKGFAVYHEGYQHFVAHYGLKQMAYVTLTPDRKPGARHLHQLRTQLKDQAVCLFNEPYYDPKLTDSLAAELGLRTGVLDPIGRDNVKSYESLLVAMADSFSACLSAR